MLPTMISAVDFQYESKDQKLGQTPASNKRRKGEDRAGSDAILRSSRRFEQCFLRAATPSTPADTAIEMTAAGYVAAMVMPARKPRYALAAPRTTVE